MAAFWPTLTSRFELEIRARMGSNRLDVVIEVKLVVIREAPEAQDLVFVHIAEYNIWW